MQYLKHKIGAISLLIIFFGLNSCAYYNTFYNTKKYFAEAKKSLEKQENTERLPSNVRNNFDKTVKQASKVLQFYPDSKYIDDSVMIIGQSFYYLRNYTKAERKFNELLENFPKSDYVPETKIWLAKSHLQLKKYDQAEIEFKVIIEKEKNKTLRNEARYWLGQCYYAEKKFDQAADAYKSVVKKLKDRRLKVDAYLRLGEINRDKGEFLTAAEYFRSAAETAKDVNVKFSAMVQFGKAHVAAKDYEKAARIFLNLIDKFFSHKEIGLAKLALGRVHQALGQTEKALEWYQVIIEDHPRTEAALGAYLELGHYEETVNYDYEKAKEYYTKGKTQSTKGDSYKEIGRRLTDIQQLISLEKKIAQLNSQIASVIARENGTELANDAEKKVEKDVLPENEDDIPRKRKNKPQPRKLKPAKKLTAADLDSLNAVLVDQKLALAELFLFQYNRADSAFVHYLDILSNDAGEAHRALAFYALAYIFDHYDHKIQMRDSLYQILAKNYSTTKQGRAAASRLGMVIPDEKKSEDVVYFEKIEDRLIEKKQATRNLSDLANFMADYPNSALLPRALHAQGWIYETHLREPQKAYDIYKDLIEKYPKSPYAKEVRRRVRGVDDKKKEEEKAKLETDKKDDATKPGAVKAKPNLKKKSIDDDLPLRKDNKRRRNKKGKAAPRDDI